jgi:8-oxo-dGTP pyrophosphatase MutT (NUDIX family)
MRRGEVEIVLVRARSAPHGWVLPKGHIEKGEMPEETARREVREEAGVDAEPGERVGKAEYKAPGEDVRVVFFLMKFIGNVTPDEKRELRWCTIDEALALSPFESVHEILRTADSRLATRRSAKPS